MKRVGTNIAYIREGAQVWIRFWDWTAVAGRLANVNLTQLDQNDLPRILLITQWHWLRIVVVQRMHVNYPFQEAVISQGDEQFPSLMNLQENLQLKKLDWRKSLTYSDPDLFFDQGMEIHPSTICELWWISIQNCQWWISMHPLDCLSSLLNLFFFFCKTLKTALSIMWS